MKSIFNNKNQIIKLFLIPIYILVSIFFVATCDEETNQNNSAIYAATNGGGLSISTDGGNTFTTNLQGNSLGL